MQLVFVLVVLVSLLACFRSYFLSFRSQSPLDYVDTNPVFSLQTHLNGEILTEGVMYGIAGRVVNRFVARMVAQWDGANGTLTEYFTFSNGVTKDRRWRLKLGSGNTFTAVADDIVGVGKGIISGATITMKYKLVMSQEDGINTFSVTDWMYLTENGTIITRSELRKFGFKVAEVIGTMRLD